MKTERAPWGTQDGVGPSPTIVTDVIPDCRDCSAFDAVAYGPDGRNAASIRVRRHVAKTGHRAGVSITRLHTFRRAE